MYHMGIETCQCNIPPGNKTLTLGLINQSCTLARQFMYALTFVVNSSLIVFGAAGVLPCSGVIGHIAEQYKFGRCTPQIAGIDTLVQKTGQCYRMRKCEPWTSGHGALA